MSAGVFHDLRAHAARAGYELHRTAAEDGAQQFLIVRWGCVKALGDLDAVVAWLQRVGVPLPAHLTAAA